MGRRACSTPRRSGPKWVELLSRDVAAAGPFYESLFGWKGATQDAGEVTYTEAPSHWAVYFAVASRRATAERAEARGGTVLRPPSRVGSERFAVLADPQGATFSVLEPAGR